MQTVKTGVMVQTPAENETPSYSAEVELEGNEVNPWPYLCSIMQCKLCLPRETKLAAYKINPSQACRGKVRNHAHFMPIQKIPKMSVFSSLAR